MNKERFLSSGLLEQYVLGLTSPEENEEVEAYIRRYPEIKQEVEGMRRAIEQYAMQHSIPPPPHLRENILQEIGQDRQSASGAPSELATNRFRWPILLTSVLAIGFGLLSAFLFRQNNAQIQEMQSLQVEYALYREACDAREQQVAELNRINAFLTHRQTQPVELQGTSLSPQARALVYWNSQEAKAYFNSLNLPDPPQGKQYQVWADVEGEMINMGLLDPEAPGLQAISYIDGAESLNITLEPLGGSAHPTVDLLFANGAI